MAMRMWISRILQSHLHRWRSHLSASAGAHAHAHERACADAWMRVLGGG